MGPAWSQELGHAKAIRVSPRIPWTGMRNGHASLSKCNPRRGRASGFPEPVNSRMLLLKPKTSTVGGTTRRPFAVPTNATGAE